MAPSSKQLSQKEYLKKYLNKRKKKKSNHGSRRENVKLIDDDVVPRIDDTQFDLEDGEDAPVIAGFYDERPAEIKSMENYRNSQRWQPVPNAEKELDDKRSSPASKHQKSKYPAEEHTSCTSVSKKHDEDTRSKKHKYSSTYADSSSPSRSRQALSPPPKRRTPSRNEKKLKERGYSPSRRGVRGKSGERSSHLEYRSRSRDREHSARRTARNSCGGEGDRHRQEGIMLEDKPTRSKLRITENSPIRHHKRGSDRDEHRASGRKNDSYISSPAERNKRDRYLSPSRRKEKSDDRQYQEKLRKDYPTKNRASPPKYQRSRFASEDESPPRHQSNRVEKSTTDSNFRYRHNSPPIRGDRHVSPRRLSPFRGDRRLSPSRADRRASPFRGDRRASPVRNDYRASPMRIDRHAPSRNLSPMRNAPLRNLSSPTRAHSDHRSRRSLTPLRRSHPRELRKYDHSPTLNDRHRDRRDDRSKNGKHGREVASPARNATRCVGDQELSPRRRKDRRRLGKIEWKTQAEVSPAASTRHVEVSSASHGSPRRYETVYLKKKLKQMVTLPPSSSASSSAKQLDNRQRSKYESISPKHRNARFERQESSSRYRSEYESSSSVRGDEQRLRSHRHDSFSRPSVERDRGWRSTGSDLNLSPVDSSWNHHRQERQSGDGSSSKGGRQHRDQDESEKSSRLEDGKFGLLSSKKSSFKSEEKITEEVSGKNATTIYRDRKTGKKRDLRAEHLEKIEKRRREEEKKEQYYQWGRGLKQVEEEKERINDELYEMSKPLARYADDDDLDRTLKEKEILHLDPMLEYIRRKKRKKDIKEGKVTKPTYKGSWPPNRFNIPPGHKWDGVDRSNGYENRFFVKQSDKRAMEEEAYKWCSEDM